MIDEKMILDAAKECGVFMGFPNPDKTYIAFAKRMYAAGLLAGAEKCESYALNKVTKDHSYVGIQCAEALREMARLPI